MILNCAQSASNSHRPDFLTDHWFFNGEEMRLKNYIALAAIEGKESLRERQRLMDEACAVSTADWFDRYA
jgi:hypothetical protein